MNQMIGSKPNETDQSALPTRVTPQAVHEELERILVDPLFRYSRRYSSLLKFIVTHTLNGTFENLKERIIGIEVFGRDPDYDTSSDSSVRVAANEVRKRLARYYASANHENELRIEIPIRAYRAEFVSAKELMRPPLNRRIRRWYLWTPAAMLILTIAVWFMFRYFSPPSAIDRFWAPVLRDANPVLICVGSPLDSNGRLAGPFSAADLAEKPISILGSEDQLKVGLKDASRAEELAAFLRQKGKQSVIRPTPGTQLAELRSNPVFLYGMFLNEWAAALRSDVHFRFRKESVGGLRWIEDAGHPANRNWSINMSAPLEQLVRDYALITRVQNQTTGQWWISVAGLTSEGTLAASQTVMHPNAMDAIAKTLPKGWEQKNVQVVLEVKIVSGSLGDPHIVSTYTW
jgi:hypothetical protein